MQSSEWTIMALACRRSSASASSAYFSACIGVPNTAAPASAWQSFAARWNAWAVKSALRARPGVGAAFGSSCAKAPPPSQKVGSFSLDQVLEKLSNAQTSGQ